MGIRATGAILRMALGALFFTAGLVKLLDPGFIYGGLLHTLSDFGPAFPFYREYVLLRLVEPHLEIFAYAVPLSEIALGISFILGCLVSWAAAGGAFLLLNIGLAIGYGQYWVLPLHAAGALLLIAMGRATPGLTWGLDAVLVKRFPASLVLFPLRKHIPAEFRRIRIDAPRYDSRQIHRRGR